MMRDLLITAIDVKYLWFLLVTSHKYCYHHCDVSPRFIIEGNDDYQWERVKINCIFFHLQTQPPVSELLHEALFDFKVSPFHLAYRGDRPRWRNMPSGISSSCSCLSNGSYSGPISTTLAGTLHYQGLPSLEHGEECCCHQHQRLKIIEMGWE